MPSLSGLLPIFNAKDPYLPSTHLTPSATQPPALPTPTYTQMVHALIAPPPAYNAIPLQSVYPARLALIVSLRALPAHPCLATTKLIIKLLIPALLPVITVPLQLRTAPHVFSLTF